MNPVVAIVPSGPATQEDIARIEKKLDAALEALRVASVKDVPARLTTRQAMAFLNIKTPQAFNAWLIAHAPLARLRYGYYSRARLEMGRARELIGVKEAAK